MDLAGNKTRVLLIIGMKPIGNPMHLAFKLFRLLKLSVEVAYLYITWGRVFYICTKVNYLPLGK